MWMAILAVVSLIGRGSLAPDFERTGVAVTALGMNGLLSMPSAIARLAGMPEMAWNIRNGDRSRTHTSRATRAVARANALLSGTLPQKILCCSETARRIRAAASRAELGELGRQRTSREFELDAVISRYESAFREMVHGACPGKNESIGSCAE